MSDPRTTANQQLRDELDQLIRVSDTEILREIFNFHEQHALRINEQYGRWLHRVEMFMALLLRVSNEVNYRPHIDWPVNRSLQFIIATNSLKQIVSAYTLTLRGDYEDSITLLRSVYEAILRVFFVSLNPTVPHNAYNLSKQGTQFNATGLVNDQLKLNWNTYMLMSVFAHSNKFQVIEQITRLAKGEKFPVNFNYYENQTVLESNINFLDFLLLMHMRLYEDVFVIDTSPQNGQDNIQQEHDLLKRYSDISTELFKTHPSKYWRGIPRDLNDIFLLIKFADYNPAQDWRPHWTSIRNGCLRSEVTRLVSVLNDVA